MFYWYGWELEVLRELWYNNSTNLTVGGKYRQNEWADYGL